MNSGLVHPNQLFPIPGFSLPRTVFPWAQVLLNQEKSMTCFNNLKPGPIWYRRGRERCTGIPVWRGELYHRNKILFAGDSAGQVLPLSYEGIYYAMKAGEMAVRAILEEKVGNYKKMWKARFQKRFFLLDRLNRYFLKDDASAEKLIVLHRRPEVQEASLLLWLRKDKSRQSLRNYLKLFGKFLS